GMTFSAPSKLPVYAASNGILGGMVVIGTDRRQLCEDPSVWVQFRGPTSYIVCQCGWYGEPAASERCSGAVNAARKCRMEQTRTIALYEAATNVVVGYVLASPRSWRCSRCSASRP